MYRRRRSIFELFRQIEEEIDREIEWFFTRLKEEEMKSRCMEPLYEVRELADELVVTIDLPGVNKSDIKLMISEDTLYLQAPCSYDTMFHGRYRRLADSYKLEVPLPSEVDPNTAKTRFKEGILEVRLAKKQKGVRIKVE